MFNLQFFNSIQGWFLHDEGQWLYESCCKCQRVLEIGAWQGRSTYAMLSGLCDAPGLCNDKIAVSVDPYQMLTEPEYYGELKTASGRKLIIDQFHYNISEFSNKVHHQLLIYKAEAAYPILAKDFPLFDLAFIDGNHEEKFVALDIIECLKLLRPGGRLCGHDCHAKEHHNRGVRAAVTKLLPDYTMGPGSIWYYDPPIGTI